MNTLISLALVAFAIQDKPVDIPKAELPKSAMCVVCALNGESEEERPVAGVKYLGKSFFFCNAKEVGEFRKDPESFMPPVLPRAAEPMNAKTVDGSVVTLADYKGKVVLVDFWATWCAPCVKAMPDLQKLHAKYAEQGFTVLGVSIDQEPKKAIDFQAKRKFAYPIVIDSLEKPTWAAWKVKAIPAMFLVNREGQIVAQWRGEQSLKKIEAEVVKALSRSGE